MAVFMGILCLVNTQEIFHRINYGTVFQSLPPLISTSEYWTHTFVIPIDPPVALSHQVPSCDCPKFLPVFEQFASMHNITVNRVKEISSKILLHFHFNNQAHGKTSRSRRSLLPFIGQISKGLFGTATSSDLKRVASHVNMLHSSIMKINKKFQHQADLLSSYMQISNRRMDNAFKAIVNNHKTMAHIQAELSASLENIQKFDSWIITELINQIEFHQIIRAQYNTLYEEFGSLLNGELSPLLVDREHLQTVIDHIAHKISLHRPTYHLIHMSPSFYYKHAEFLLHKMSSNILITVRFPVAEKHQPMELYRIISFPVPINNSAPHATAIIDMPEYLALNTANHVYSTLSASILHGCDIGQYFTHCHFNLPVSPTSHITCALALFQGNKRNIHDYCTFRFKPNAVRPTITPLNSTHMLLINIQSAILQCNTKATQIIQCQYCMIELPCHCSLKSKSHMLPPRFTGCHHSKDNLTITHPVNLILLQKFFGDKAVSNIQPNSTFIKPLNVSIKPFRFYNNQFSHSVANDKQDHLNLDKMVTAAKEDKLIYNDMAETFMDSDMWQTNSLSMQYVLTITAISLSVISFTIIIFLCKKMKTLSTALLLSQQIKSSSALTTLPSFIYTNKPSTPLDKSVISQIHDMLPNFNTYILLALTIIAFIYFIKVQSSKISKPTLVLEVLNSKSSIICKVQHLPTCLKHCMFLSQTPISIDYVQVSMYSFVKINWNGFNIQVKNNAHTLSPNSKIELNPFTAYKFKKMISDPFKPYIVQLWIMHNNYCLPIDVTCYDSGMENNTLDIEPFLNNA